MVVAAGVAATSSTAAGWLEGKTTEEERALVSVVLRVPAALRAAAIAPGVRACTIAKVLRSMSDAALTAATSASLAALVTTAVTVLSRPIMSNSVPSTAASLPSPGTRTTATNLRVSLPSLP
eukprot:245398-Pleurochrysis_carterae.AAC.1